jgi:hypothetical protein
LILVYFVHHSSPTSLYIYPVLKIFKKLVHLYIFHKFHFNFLLLCVQAQEVSLKCDHRFVYDFQIKSKLINTSIVLPMIQTNYYLSHVRAHERKICVVAKERDCLMCTQISTYCICGFYFFIFNLLFFW